MKKLVEIEVEVRAETNDAIQVFDGKRTVWIPRSQIDDETETEGEVTSILIPEWLAIEKELV